MNREIYELTDEEINAAIDGFDDELKVAREDESLEATERRHLIEDLKSQQSDYKWERSRRREDDEWTI